jgi:CheY-like chemotaxis protein
MARVLVVDDSEEIRSVLRLTLELEGYQVLEARDGEEALQVQLAGADVMLLDVMMPVLDGWGVLAGLRSRRGRGFPRVIMLTAKAGEKDRQRALRQGAVAFIPKPFDSDEVLREVGRVAAQPQETLEDLREHQMYLTRLLSQVERVFPSASG